MLDSKRFMIFITTYLTLSCFALSIEKRTVAVVLSDLNNLTSSIKTLDSAVNSLPQEGLSAALAIEQQVNSIISTLQQTHNDVVSTGSVSSTDANSILDAIKILQPEIIQTLNDFVTQKPEVVKLNNQLSGLTQLAETDLKALESNTTAVENAIISAAPDTLKPTASIISSSINAAFETAIAAYAT